MRKRQQVINMLGINFTLSLSEEQIYSSQLKRANAKEIKLLTE
jgi:hypothetical protein